MGWMPHTEGLCKGRGAPTSWHLLPVCRGVLLGWVLLLANQQLTPDIASREELKAKEGCQEELPAHTAMLSSAWRHGLPVLGGTRAAGIPHTSCHPPGHPRETCSPPKLWLLKLVPLQLEVEPGKRLSLHFPFTMGEISLAISIPLGSPEFSQTCCLGLG